MKKISIIIPVYNGEEYISRCIDSVLSQKNFDINALEILIVNDGSKDGSLKILEQYEKKHESIIKVIDQKNAGVAKTRNLGIGLATGKYTMFIDQDDYIDADFCNFFYAAAEKDSCDVVVGGYRRPDEKNNIIRIVEQSDTEYSKKYKISAAWAKMHRTRFLQANKIEFYDNNYGEDIIFTMDENALAHKVVAINYIGYNWYWNSESVSNTSQRGLKDTIKFIELLHNMVPRIKTKLDEYYLLQTGVHYLLFSGRQASSADFMKLYKDIFTVNYDNNFAQHLTKLILFGPEGALFSVRVAIGSFTVLHKLNLVALFAKIYCNGKKS